jgi:hypothetical protein
MCDKFSLEIAWKHRKYSRILMPCPRYVHSAAKYGNVKKKEGFWRPWTPELARSLSPHVKSGAMFSLPFQARFSE